MHWHKVKFDLNNNFSRLRPVKELLDVYCQRSIDYPQIRAFIGSLDEKQDRATVRNLPLAALSRYLDLRDLVGKKGTFKFKGDTGHAGSIDDGL